MFGATGDLARRMLLPSLYGLDSDSLLPEGLRIIGTARTDLDDAGFRERADAALQEHLPAGFYSAGIAERLLSRLHYVPLDITDESSFGKLASAIGDPCHGVGIFLSTAPSLFKPTIDGLEAAGLACPTVRMALEKPLGSDLESSREINDAVAGADAEHTTVTGQYTRGAIDGEPVPGYAEEVGHESSTETFVALKANVDNWRWKGVPFYMRTGKRMPERQSEIFIQFREVPFSIFASRGATTRPNKLIIGLQPDESIELRLMAKTPGLDRQGVRLREVPLDLGLANAFSEYRRRIAYERLLLDLIEGDPTLFVRRDE